jgi:hypothetical protein
MIPAETESHTVRLMCVPIEKGELQIEGVLIRMLGGCLEETIVPLQRYLNDTKLFTKNGKLRMQTEKARYNTIPTVKTPMSVEKSKLPKWFLPIQIIPPQPMLELIETSLGSHQTITLFEGEKSRVHFTIRNVGTIPINYLFFKIQDKMLPFENDDMYENEVYQKNIKAFYLIENDLGDIEPNLKAEHGYVTKLTNCFDMEPIKLSQILNPGQQVTLKLGVFGKSNWYVFNNVVSAEMYK